MPRLMLTIVSISSSSWRPTRSLLGSVSCRVHPVHGHHLICLVGACAISRAADFRAFGSRSFHSAALDKEASNSATKLLSGSNSVSAPVHWLQPCGWLQPLVAPATPASGTNNTFLPKLHMEEEALEVFFLSMTRFLHSFECPPRVRHTNLSHRRAFQSLCSSLRCQPDAHPNNLGQT